VNYRVRFAPSPTGQLHLGGARTALFNYLFAKRSKGKFLLRIEDTDRERSRREHVEQILDSLSWLGLDWDDEPVFQSSRSDRYSEIVERLLANRNAYRCFATEKELNKIREETKTYLYPGLWRDRSESEVQSKMDAGESFTVRLRTPLSGSTSFIDQIYNKIETPNKEIDDFVIARSDGGPVYNLVVAVDDHDMGITHVIRGEDHVSNTPKQIMVYQALNWNLPSFAHLPMILGPDQKRLSKRHGATGVQAFREQGYLPEALINYLTLLGWNPGTDQEMFNREQLAETFDLGKVNKKSAVFDVKKLNWISGHHLMFRSNMDILDNVRGLIPEWGKTGSDAYAMKVIDQLKVRSKTLIHLAEQSKYFFTDPESCDEEARMRFWKDNTRELLNTYFKDISELDDWDQSSLESSLRTVADDAGVGAGKIIHPVRLALSGVAHGPSLFIMMELLGKERCIRRIRTVINLL
tara:strand:- start:779 stop:2176 length:1398 start_codon:yes stop_codon:yes gene_type:complete